MNDANIVDSNVFTANTPAVNQASGYWDLFLSNLSQLQANGVEIILSTILLVILVRWLIGRIIQINDVVAYIVSVGIIVFSSPYWIPVATGILARV